MSRLQDIQQAFLRSLQADDSELFDYIAEQAPVDTATRLGIYQNAYRARLKETVETDHPMLGLYLGDELFDEMVAGYIHQFPSEHPSLRHFCRHIPIFLRRNKPFSQHVIVAEIAEFEQLLINAFDAPESDVTDINQLMAIDPNSWPGMTLRFHPSVQLFKADFNSVESWQHLKQEMAPPAPLQLSESRTWILWRNQERLTEFRSLEPDETLLIGIALKGGDFSQMCDELLNWYVPDDVAPRALAVLQQWLHQGIIQKIVA